MTKKEVTQLSYDIIGMAIKVHKELGAGLLESIYEDCLKYELIKNGYNVSSRGLCRWISHWRSWTVCVC